MVDDEPRDMDSVGQRLRAAREAKGLSIEEVASSTRIPTRHLLSLEQSEWGNLPAPTYSVGFAKNYATAVGLDKVEIAEALRLEMGSELPAHYTTVPDSFEPIDNNRSMPKGLVIGALIALIAIAVLLTQLNNRALDGNDAALPTADTSGPAPVAVVTPAAQGSVVITANEPVWIEVRDGATILRQAELAAGQSFEVPASAARPVLTTGKPEALRISVGTGDAPAIGPAGSRISGVSLLAADLMRGPVAPVAGTPVPESLATDLGEPAATPR